MLYPAELRGHAGALCLLAAAYARIQDGQGRPIAGLPGPLGPDRQRGGGARHR